MTTDLLRDMSPRQRQILLGLGAGLIVLLLGWLFWPTAKPEGKQSVGTLDVPIVMHTSGGRLEVATVTATEAFKLNAPAKTFLGIDLGNTVSQIQAKVVYRFHIEMAKKWPVRFQGNLAIIEASEVKPTLPVAFDTSTLQKQTSSGWGRFDKHTNLFELEKRMSPELERRSYGYKALALPHARQSVADFARTWLAKDANWKALNVTEIRVVFPGDPPVGNTTIRPQPQVQ
ncbi:MAG: hypothetical protein DDT34_02099 [Firmicutes bacterium]|nr:hypothetical protein [Bacillota bacterium]